MSKSTIRYWYYHPYLKGRIMIRRYQDVKVLDLDPIEIIVLYSQAAELVNKIDLRSFDPNRRDHIAFYAFRDAVWLNVIATADAVALEGIHPASRTDLFRIACKLLKQVHNDKTFEHLVYDRKETVPKAVLHEISAEIKNPRIYGNTK